MGKILLSTFLAFITLFSYSVAWEADWQLFGESDAGSHSYDVESITHLSNDIVRVWCNQVYNEKFIKKMIVELGKKFENLHNSRDLFEINCKDYTYRLLSSTIYAKDGTVITSSKMSDAEWKFVLPGLLSEGLYEKVCK